MASGEGNAGGDQDRRHPRNMQGLLTLCAGLSDQTSDTDSQQAAPMDEEKRVFLENAMKEYSVNPVEVMRQNIETVKGPEDSEDSVDIKIQALESLIEWCEQIDLAMDFHKIGGFIIFPLVLSHQEAEIRWLGCELLASLAQNNPYCQEAILKDDKLVELLKILDTDRDPTVKTKSLYALSCLLRDCEAAQKLFLENDGFSVIMRAMQTDVEKLKIKAAFMISGICKDKPEYKDILCDIGMVEQLIGNLCEEHTAYHEHLMSALLTIVHNHSRSIAECSRPELNFGAVLTERKRELLGKEEFREELEYTEELLKILTAHSNTSGSTEMQEASR